MFVDVLDELDTLPPLDCVLLLEPVRVDEFELP